MAREKIVFRKVRDIESRVEYLIGFLIGKPIITLDSMDIKNINQEWNKH